MSGVREQNDSTLRRGPICAFCPTTNFASPARWRLWRPAIRRIPEGAKINEMALKALIRAAVALNASKAKKKPAKKS